MNSAVEILLRERGQALDQVRELRARVRDLDAALTLLGHDVIERSGSRGGGELKTKVLETLLGASEGKTPKEIASAISQGGRQTSDQSVSSTLSRLKGEARVTNQYGKWFLQIAESSDSAMARDDESQDLIMDWEEDDVP